MRARFGPACEKRRCTHAIGVNSRYRSETGAFKCQIYDHPYSPTQIQTSLEPEDDPPTFSSCPSSPESASLIPYTSVPPFSWDLDPPSIVASPATALPKNAGPWISYSTSSPTVSATAVVTLDAVTVAGIIGITIEGTAPPSSEDLDPPSIVTSPATALPKNVVPWISYSTSSPTVSATAVVTLSAVTEGWIIGIMIGGTALSMAILVCCFFAWRHRCGIFKDRGKLLATQTIKSKHAPMITPYHWPLESGSNAGLGPSKPVPQMTRFANTPPESVVEVEIASEWEVDLGK